MAPERTEAQLKEIVSSGGTTIDPLAYVKPLLDEDEARDFLDSCGELGPDPTSRHFVERKKCIGYLAKMHGRWFQVNDVDHIFQNSSYNDFTGGFKRKFQMFPRTFIECPAVQKVMDEFQAAFNFPDGKLVFVNVQSSHIDVNNSVPGSAYDIHVSPPDGDSNDLSEAILSEPDQLVAGDSNTKQSKPTHQLQQSITGQGIHTDGLDHGMILCLKRDNVGGAKNSIYGDVMGADVLMDPFVLEEGNALIWQDNKVFHYVSPASLVDKSKGGIRTVLILLYPGNLLVTGEPNPNNTLGKKVFDPSLQLRFKADPEQ